MDLRMTVVRLDGSSVDVLLRVPGGVSADAVRAAVAEAADTGDAPLFVAGRPFVDPLVLGAPPLLHGAVLTARPPAGVDPTVGRCAVAELRVVGGPDAGGVHRLRPGTHRVGRAADVEVRVRDPAVSRVHCVLTVSGDGVRVRDALSRNGVRAAAGACAGDGALQRPLGTAERLVVGDTTLEVHPVTEQPASLRRGGAGRLHLNRSPRRGSAVPRTVVDLPAEPARPDAPRVPWLAAVLPLAVSLPLALWWGPAALLLGLGGPVVVLGTAWQERRSRSREHVAAMAAHRRATAAAQAMLADAVVAEQQARRDAAPDPAVVGAAGRHRGRRTWERGPDDPDALVLRVGTATQPGHTAGRAAGGGDAVPVEVPDVPACVALPAVGVLGVAGPAGRRAGLLRWLVGQVAVLHSPRDVRLVVVAPGARGWEWAGWLPHTASPTGRRGAVAATEQQAAARLEELADLVRRRSAAGAATGHPGPRVVLVVDGVRAMTGRPGLATVLDDGPRVGVLTVCAEDGPDALPPECRTVALLDERGGRLRVEPRHCGPPAGEVRALDVTADLVAATWAEAVARGLAPLVDASALPAAGGDLPREVDLLALLHADGVEALRPDSVVAGWQRRRRSTRAVLGSTGRGVWAPDLRTAGPHALVGGTTGSGKSLLLQALVLSLAVVNRPEEMAFVLVDFKGGAAFGGCAALPHTAGLVTDLDPHLTARALTSLRAEVRRRERLLAASGAADLEEHQRLADAGRATPLGRLAIVVDEYRALAEELPDLLGSLVRLAAVGRSLGIHLVLATQRPAGVVSADVRANVNLRVALRVRDPADSEDVLGAPAAADIDPACPGRALARSGGEELVAVQVARVGAGDRPSAQAVVERLGWEQLGEPEPVTAGAPGGELDRVVAALARAAALGGGRPAASPWRPPLPDVLPWPGVPTAVAAPAPVVASSLGTASAPGAGSPPGDPAPLDASVPVDGRVAGTAPSARSGADEEPVLHLGLLDVPERQAHERFCWDLGQRRSVVVAGAPRSGRSGVLRAVAAAVATHPPDRLHVQVLDGADCLADLAALPHTGSVVGRGDPARACRLLERLLDRTSRGAGGRAGGGGRARAGAGGQPWVLLLIDALDRLWPELDAHDGGRGADLLLQLLRAGPGAGVLSLLTGDRSLLGGRLAGLATERWLLRPGDPGDLLLAGVPAGSAPAHQPVGRLVRVSGPDVHEAQLFHVSAADVLAAAGRPQPRPAPGRAPLRVPAMPDRLHVRDLLTGGGLGASPAPGPLLLGVGGRDVEPMGLDVTGRAALVAGPPGSGRSTALRTAAHSALHRGLRVVLLVPGPRADREQPVLARTARATAGELVVLDGSDHADLRAALAGADLVLVDDVALLHDGDAEQALLAALDTAPRTGTGLLVAGAISDLAQRFGGLAAAARRSRCGLVLGATPADGDLFGVTLPRGTGHRPGRGYLVRHGAVDPIQVADSC